MDFFTVNADMARGGDAEANFVPLDGSDGHGDAVVDDDFLADFAGQNEHGFTFLGEDLFFPQ